jgi:hypothetical protein
MNSPQKPTQLPTTIAQTELDAPLASGAGAKNCIAHLAGILQANAVIS